MTGIVRARPGDPILSRDSERIVARWAVGMEFARGAHVFNWTWLDDVTQPPAMERGPFGQQPVNRASVVLEFGPGPVQVWRAAWINGTDDEGAAFRGVPWFMPPEAQPGPDPAGMVRAIDELLRAGHPSPMRGDWLRIVRDRYRAQVNRD